jgi:hypothetical protein
MNAWIPLQADAVADHQPDWGFEQFFDRIGNLSRRCKLLGRWNGRNKRIMNRCGTTASRFKVLFFCFSVDTYVTFGLSFPVLLSPLNNTNSLLTSLFPECKEEDEEDKLYWHGPARAPGPNPIWEESSEISGSEPFAFTPNTHPLAVESGKPPLSDYRRPLVISICSSFYFGGS